MARQREFDEDQVLDSVIRAFWRKGYEATSLTDLMAASGLSKGSIYKAFGDKHQLFMLAIERYLNEVKQRSDESLASQTSPVEGLKTWQKDMLEHADQNEDACKGCLAMNTSMELGPHDDVVRKLLEDQQNLVLAQLHEKAEEAQRKGELREDIPSGDIALLMGLVHLGLNVAITNSIDHATGDHLIDLVFKLLQPEK